MPGRDVSIRTDAPERRSSGRFAAWTIAALALVAIGIALGSRIASQPESAPFAVDATSVPDTKTDPAPRRPTPARENRTRAGAVAAASRSVTAFDGDVLLDRVRLRAVVARITSVATRAQLIEAFSQASAQTRAMLGVDTIPRPVIVLRSVPVGYRVERYSSAEATIAVWYVGIVGSGATVQPQQSWRTQVVSLVWEAGAWKVSSFASSPGPTPPLSTVETTYAPGDLFAAIPRFEEFERAEP